MREGKRVYTCFLIDVAVHVGVMVKMETRPKISKSENIYDLDNLFEKQKKIRYRKIIIIFECCNRTVDPVDVLTSVHLTCPLFTVHLTMSVDDCTSCWCLMCDTESFCDLLGDDLSDSEKIPDSWSVKWSFSLSSGHFDETAEFRSIISNA